MAIRAKTLIIIGLTALSFVVVVLLLSQTVLLGSFEHLETETVTDHVTRATNAVLNDLSTLGATNADWAHWDDTYQFVQDGSADYIDANLFDDVFVTLNTNLMLFANQTGDVVFAKMVDLDEGQEVTLPAGIQELAATYSQRAQQNDPTGIVLLDGRPILLSARAILTSAKQGPAEGALILGRWLDEAKVGELSESLGLSLSIQQWDTPDLPSDFAAFRVQGITGSAEFVQPLDNDRIAGYSVLRDPMDEPVLILRVDVPRDIYRQGQTTLSYFLLLMLLAGAAIMLTVLTSLDRVVIARLKLLHTTVDRVRHDVTTKERVAIQGNDEISSLGDAMNAMLNTLDENREILRQARDEAVSALQLKSQILANVSHDSRTPLTVILLQVEKFQRGWAGELTSKQLDMVNSIGLSAKQMLFFMTNMLDEAALSNGRLKLRYAPFEPAELLNEVEAAMCPLASRRGLEFKVELDAALPTTLKGDSDRLKQIIFNLVSNAIKFTDSGSVSVSFGVADPNHWKIIVKDTGRGIPEEAQDKIYEAFFQVDGSATRETTSGVGLGLSIVKRLTELMGGTIKLHSQLNVGTEFEILLPAEMEGLKVA